MRWRRRKTKAEGTSPAVDCTEELAQIRQELEELETAKSEARERASEISRITRTLRTLGERNHFAPMVWDALKGEFK